MLKYVIHVNFSRYHSGQKVFLCSYLKTKKQNKQTKDNNQKTKTKRKKKLPEPLSPCLKRYSSSKTSKGFHRIPKKCTANYSSCSSHQFPLFSH